MKLAITLRQLKRSEFFLSRIKTCAQLRSERTEDGMRTYCGRVDGSVNEVVE